MGTHVDHNLDDPGPYTPIVYNECIIGRYIKW